MTNIDKAPGQEIFFRLSEIGYSPWEINRPQPVIVNLVNKGIFHGEILDVGCGIGDNAIHIAMNSTNVHLTAIDFVPKTLDIAREKAKENNVNIQFQLINFLQDLSLTNFKKNSFDIILDSAVFHCFSDEDRQYFINNLQYLIKPGGLYIQFCFSEKRTSINCGPRCIKQSDLYSLFSTDNGWTIQSIEDAIYITRPDSIFGTENQAYLSIIRRNQF